MSIETTLAPDPAAASVPRAGPAATAAALASSFEAGAARADAEDRFVADNFAALREAGLVEAGVPAELGGGGAEVAELCEMLRVLGRACGSTALAFAMHTHQVAIPAWRWRHRQVAAVEPLLRRIAAERLLLLSSGGSDWIAGSGRARRVEGGYRVSARKVFTSGAPTGDLLMTSALLEEGDSRKVIHFAASMKAPEVRIEETWRAMGMRGTGSHDVLIEDLFVPDAAVPLARNAGEWHPLFQIIATIAFPLIYAAYLGTAEAARDIALRLARKRAPDAALLDLAGRMETALRAAQLGHARMVAVAETNEPGADSVNETMIAKRIVTENILRAGELALELGGGAGFYRDAGLERRFRDLQGARYHPLQQGQQAAYAGATALGLSTATIF